ncbi:hypothetical protein ACFL3C_01345 [Patescibacteria group bacterium]
MQNKSKKLTRKIARIWSGPVILYGLLILVGHLVSWITTGKADPYAVEDYPFIENLPPLFMLIAVVGLVIAWRKEKIGGSINLLFCLATLPILLIHWPITEDTRFVVPYILLVIIAVPGVLFIMSSNRK